TEQAPLGFNRFDDKFSKQNKKQLKKIGDDKNNLRSFRKRFDRIIDETVEYLTDDQEKELSNLLKTIPSPQLLRLESQKAVFEKFKTVRGDEKSRRKFIHDYFNKWDSLQMGTYKEARNKFQNALKAWSFEQIEKLEPEQ